MGGDIGLNKVKFSRSPPFECYFTEVIAPNNFWWFSRPPPPPRLHFPSKFEWSPLLNPSKVFSDLRFWIISDDWFPILFSQKSSDPLKSSLPPSQAINNDRSLIGVRLRRRPRLTTLYCRHKAMALSGSRHALQDNSPTAQQLWFSKQFILISFLFFHNLCFLFC